jgi:hypothetical protein
MPPFETKSRATRSRFRSSILRPAFIIFINRFMPGRQIEMSRRTDGRFKFFDENFGSFNRTAAGCWKKWNGKFVRNGKQFGLRDVEGGFQFGVAVQDGSS